jgi:class 3 adenylate cyclase
LKELNYRFELRLASSRERLWPLVSDTNRFNRDAGIPAVEELGVDGNARRRLRLTRLGVDVEWEEEPFEWVSPERFSVARRYTRGPLASMRTTATLEPLEGGGTRLVYDVRARPRGLVGLAAAAAQVGVLSRRRFSAVLREYDRVAGDVAASLPRAAARLAPGAERRIAAAREAVIAAGAPPAEVDRLCSLVSEGDELVVAELRPYALADVWGSGRRETLELCLLATRHGLLELRWELLCPLCRGAAATETSLDAVARTVHCGTCRIDFTADMSRSVEVVFRPAETIRPVARTEFCVAGPQVTPHVVAQQLLAGGETRTLNLRLEPGRYRLRALGAGGEVSVSVGDDGMTSARTTLGAGDVTLARDAALTIENTEPDERLVLLERTAWSDQAAPAADVTALQAYRDLFAAEALRLGEPISVGTLTVVFTDLLGSTRYYREVGDAPAFGAVLWHIDALREAVAREDGAVVKAMGDAIMAVFRRPVNAVQAMRAAQEATAGRPLALKVGIHTGPCIAVTQNGVLDYFGSTVNLAARLVSLSTGQDLIVSGDVLVDPEVAALELGAEQLDGSVVKGFEDEALSLWRVHA